MRQLFGAPLERLLGSVPMAVKAWSFDVGAVKPEPAIYRHVLERLGLPPERVLFVGDTARADYEGPRSMGMKALQLCRGAASPAPHQITSLAEVVARVALQYDAC